MITVSVPKLIETVEANHLIVKVFFDNTDDSYTVIPAYHSEQNVDSSKIKPFLGREAAEHYVSKLVWEVTFAEECNF